MPKKLVYLPNIAYQYHPVPIGKAEVSQHEVLLSRLVFEGNLDEIHTIISVVKCTIPSVGEMVEISSEKHVTKYPRYVSDASSINDSSLKSTQADSSYFPILQSPAILGSNACLSNFKIFMNV